MSSRLARRVSCDSKRRTIAREIAAEEFQFARSRPVSRVRSIRQLHNIKKLDDGDLVILVFLFVSLSAVSV